LSPFRDGGLADLKSNGDDLFHANLVAATALIQAESSITRLPRGAGVEACHDVPLRAISLSFEVLPVGK